LYFLSATFQRTLHLDDDNQGFVLPTREPYQPSNAAIIPPQMLKNRTLRFQLRWFREYSWLHFVVSTGSVFCHTCLLAKQNALANSAKWAEDTFTVTGFKNWKKGDEKFRQHQSSHAHRISVENLKSFFDVTSIDVRLLSEKEKEQKCSQKCLLKIITSLTFLAKQGMSIRGNVNEEGNFAQLLQTRAEDDEELKKWLNRKVDFCSWKIQNELLEIMASTILRQIVHEISSYSIQYGLIVDGTQDCSGSEQEAVCIRHVAQSLDVEESFMGVYYVQDTSGKGISAMSLDVLTRLNLPVSDLRYQTYDGASNMAGSFKGCQAEIKKKVPLALYIHCGAHVTHLITSKAVESCEFIRNSLHVVQELGDFYRSSGKFKHMYLQLHVSDHDIASPGTLKPICPTRFLTRAAAVKSLLDNYNDVLTALETASSEFSSRTASRAHGLYTSLSQPACLLALHSVLPFLNIMEAFNKTLQGHDATVAGMLAASDVVKENIKHLRSESSFAHLYDLAVQQIHMCNLGELTVPRQRKISLPTTTSENADQTEEITKVCFRIKYFQLLDSAMCSFGDYFSSTDIDQYKTLTDSLITGNVTDDVIARYPELTPSLSCELSFFHAQYKIISVEDCRKCFQSMHKEVRRMFPQVERLLRLILLCPVSSCTAERSFSALRRLKTWLRTTMSQVNYDLPAVFIL
jgi:hypothetical protein